MRKFLIQSVATSFLLMIFLSSPIAIARDASVLKSFPAQNSSKRILFSVTLHTEAEIESLLRRAELLSRKLKPHNKNHAGIALVLHGREIKMFDKKNYKRYRSIIDNAARLDANDILEIKVCKTLMDELNIKDEDMPSFVEIVPYGPDEEDRLITKGYTYL